MMMNGISPTNGGLASDFEVISSPGSSTAQSDLIGGANSNHSLHQQGQFLSQMSMTDLTLDEARQRLIDFAQENSELQSYLRENNEMMKRQFETLAEWKSKVQQANVANREKFEQTKVLISTLRRENSEFQQKITTLEETIQEKYRQTEELKKANEKLLEEKDKSERAVDELKQALASYQHLQDQAIENGDPKPGMEVVLVKLSEEKENEFEELRKSVQRKDAEIHEARQANENLIQDLKELQKLKEQIQQDYQRVCRENMELNQTVGIELQYNSITSMNWMNVVKKSADNAEVADENEGLSAEAVKIDVKEKPEKCEEALQQTALGDLMIQQQKTNKEYEEQIAQLQKDKQNLREEIDALKLEKQTREGEITELKTKQEQDLAECSKQYENKMAEFAMKLDKKQEEQLQSQMSASETVESLKAQVVELMGEVHETGCKLDAATSSIDRKNARIRELEEKIEKLNKELQAVQTDKARIVMSLQSHISCLQSNFKQEQEQHITTKTDCEELRQSFSRLVSDYKELLANFDKYKQSVDQGFSDEIRNLKAEIEKYKEEINKLTCQVIVAEEALTMRDETVAGLKRELEDERAKFDESINVYKAQADVYKSDFDAERQAREKQVQERERLAKDMEELRLQNQQLQDEMEAYSARQLQEMQQRVNPQENFFHITNAHLPPHGYDYTLPAGMPASTNQTQQGEGVMQEEEVEFTCPKCNIVCPDLDTLQIHVEDCMNLD